MPVTGHRLRGGPESTNPSRPARWHVFRPCVPETCMSGSARDSAFRFFPLVEGDTLGLALHPFDLATNKTLALVGRAEVRDWIDVIACHERLQPLGYLAWAACAKDPGSSVMTALRGHGDSPR